MKSLSKIPNTDFKKKLLNQLNLVAYTAFVYFIVGQSSS